jgi:hypothetical protein
VDILISSATLDEARERGLALILDISESKRAEEALRHREAEYRTLAEFMPQVVWSARPDGDIDYVNQVLANYMGKTVEEVLGIWWTELLHPEDLPLALERWTRQEDLRRRVEFEQQLIGIVSHDLRNPPGRHFARGHGAAPAGRSQRAADEERGAHPVLRRARHPPHPRPARLHPGPHGGRHSREPQAHGAAWLSPAGGGRGAARPPGAAPRRGAQGDGRGEWDPDRLAQVLTNLLSNALSYSPPDTPVTVRTRGEDGTVLLEEHNQGAPIPAERLPQLFEPLERGAAQQDRMGRGIGLGLFIVRHIVEAHGGSITVRSGAKEGTTFTVHLPRQAAGRPG